MSTVTERLTVERKRLNVERLNAVQPDLFETQSFCVRRALESWAHVVHVGIHREALKRASEATIQTASSKEAAEMLELARKKRVLWRYFSEMAGCNMHQLIREAWVNGHIPKATIEKAEQIPIMHIHYAPGEGKTIR